MALLQRLQRRLTDADGRTSNAAYARDRHALLHLIGEELGTVLQQGLAEFSQGLR